MSCKKAFTLVELMIVAAIIGILVMIAVPMYQKYLNDARQTSTKNHLQGLALTEMSLKSSDTGENFIAVHDGVDSEESIKRLTAAGFRPDPKVGFAVIPVADGMTDAFIAFAAYQIIGSQVFVYDSVKGTGVNQFDPGATYAAAPPAKLTVYLWDGSTQQVTATAELTIAASGLISDVTILEP